MKRFLIGIFSCAFLAVPQSLVWAESSHGNILYIGEGGIALPDTEEESRHWSEWTINLIEGSTAYGWTSEETIKFPHPLVFELAGNGIINSFTLDSGFTPVSREDGTVSEKPSGHALRGFSVYVSVDGVDGHYKKVLEGELEQGQRKTFSLPKPIPARWIKLVVNSNWGKESKTFLGEFEAIGELESRILPSEKDISGVYDHEYGEIVLRQIGNRVLGCYDDGKGYLAGVSLGRILRLSFYEPEKPTIGAATFSWAGDKLYGFWYRRTNQMGSPWNAKKVSTLDGAELGNCAAIIYPENK